MAYIIITGIKKENIEIRKGLKMKEFIISVINTAASQDGQKVPLEFSSEY